MRCSLGRQSPLLRFSKVLYPASNCRQPAYYVVTQPEPRCRAQPWLGVFGFIVNWSSWLGRAGISRVQVGRSNICKYFISHPQTFPHMSAPVFTKPWHLLNCRPCHTPSWNSPRYETASFSHLQYDSSSHWKPSILFSGLSFTVFYSETSLWCFFCCLRHVLLILSV